MTKFWEDFIRRAQSKVQIGKRLCMCYRNEEMERKTWFRAVLKLNWLAPTAKVSVIIFNQTQLNIYYGFLYVSTPVWTFIRKFYKTFKNKGKYIHKTYALFVGPQRYKYWSKHVAKA